MPVIEVRDAEPNEYELAPINVPALLAGVAHDFSDLSKARGSSGQVYVAANVVNGSASLVTLKDSNGRTFPVRASQTAEWDLPEGVNFLSLTPTLAINAAEVSVTLRLRREE